MVTVALRYGAGAGAGGGDQETQVREHLRHDLESYRAFVVKRCEATGCRVAA